MQASISQLFRRIERIQAQVALSRCSTELPVLMLDDAGEVVYATPVEGLPPPWRRMEVKEYDGFDPRILEGSEP